MKSVSIKTLKDWTGNAASVYYTIGASNHSASERAEHDYYATDPNTIDALLKCETFGPCIWEPACGEGHLSKRLIKHGFYVKSTDLIDRDFGFGGIDFLQESEKFPGDIITNPPYKYAAEFANKALDLIEEGHKVALFLKLTFLEGQKRYQSLFKDRPPKSVCVFVSRQVCAKNGKFDIGGQPAIAYAWYIWEKGYSGDTVIKWIV
jgi:hypothetical protein